MKTINLLLEQLIATPNSIEFNDVISTIENYYKYTPSSFSNGADEDCVTNSAGENEGSCKIFAFAKLHHLDEEKTLFCFGHYYRDDVLSHPNNTDHANIRQFMKHGWSHLVFNNTPLEFKN